MGWWLGCGVWAKRSRGCGEVIKLCYGGFGVLGSLWEVLFWFGLSFSLSFLEYDRD